MLCETLSNTLSCSGQELALELQTFPVLPNYNFILVSSQFFAGEETEGGLYMMAVRTAFTIPVTVPVTERRFSKLKLIKTHLRSTMSQECLNGLVLIKINCEIS